MSSIEAPADRQNADTALVAQRADIDTLAAMLGRAFHNDALTRWITPDPVRRAEILPDFFRIFLDISLDYDAVYTNSALDAALLFLPPGGWQEVDARGVELSQRFAEILGDEVEMMATISGLQAVHHPHTVSHYYVSFAGVDPANQRHGAMAVLVDALMARADTEGMPAYTEASSAGGTFAALRNGFVEIGVKIEIPNGPTLRPMWREPR